MRQIMINVVTLLMVFFSIIALSYICYTTERYTNQYFEPSNCCEQKLELVQQRLTTIEQKLESQKCKEK